MSLSWPVSCFLHRRVITVEAVELPIRRGCPWHRCTAFVCHNVAERHLAGHVRGPEGSIVDEDVRSGCATPPLLLTLPRTFPSLRASAQNLPLAPTPPRSTLRDSTAHLCATPPLHANHAIDWNPQRPYQPCLFATQHGKSSSATAIFSQRIPTTYMARTRACKSHKSPVYILRYTRYISGRHILRLSGTQTACLPERGPTRRPTASNSPEMQ
jgi:hypothetical protein